MDMEPNAFMLGRDGWPACPGYVNGYARGAGRACQGYAQGALIASFTPTEHNRAHLR